MSEIRRRDVPLFSEMDDREVAEIRAIMEVKKYEPVQTIVQQVEDLQQIVEENQRKMADWMTMSIKTG